MAKNEHRDVLHIPTFSEFGLGIERGQVLDIVEWMLQTDRKGYICTQR